MSTQMHALTLTHADDFVATLEFDECEIHDMRDADARFCEAHARDDDSDYVARSMSRASRFRFADEFDEQSARVERMRVALRKRIAR